MRDAAPADARQQILDSATTVFARKGYAGASVQDLLEATGLSKPTLYYYFESKAGLFRAILDRAHDDCLRIMQATTATSVGVEERLRALAIALFDFARKNQNLIRLMLASTFAAAEEIPPGCIDLTKKRRNFEFVLGIVREARKNGEIDPDYGAEEVTHAIFGAISHQIRTHLLLPDWRLDRQRAERIVTLFLSGAAKKRSRARLRSRKAGIP